MTQIELIKQEIERLENRCVTAETFAEELLSFIESLEQEPKKGLHSNSLRKVDNPIVWIEEDEAERNTPKIKGWVARDADNAIFCHENKPRRTFGHTIGGERIEYWCNGGKRFELSQELFPEISWIDEPIEVELTIRKV